MNNRLTTVMLACFLWSLTSILGGSLAYAAPCGDEGKEQECKSGYDDAKFNCDDKNNAEIQAVSAGAGTSSAAMSQPNAGSAQASCGQTGDISNVAQNALRSYKNQCSNAIENKCRKSCQAWVDYTKKKPKDCSSKIPKAQQGYDSCADHDPKVADAQQGINNYQTAQQEAGSCKQETNGEAKMPEMPKMPEPKEGEEKEKEKEKTYCEQNPEFAGCLTKGIVDCNDPTQATTNKVCVCAKTPADPMCAEGLNAGDVATQGIGIPTDSTVTPEAETPEGQRASELPGRSVRAMSDGSQSSSGGGSSASGGSSGGGGSSGSASAEPGKGTKETNAATAKAGMSSSSDSGGGSGGGGGGWGGGSFGSGDDETSGGTGGVRRSAASVNKKNDLRNYLPGGPNDPSRLAGKSDNVQRVDGITGPHSDQWRKIRYRYQVISPSLMDQP